MISKSVLVGAGVAGICVVGYCIYFDQKRRRDPDYRKKIRERREKQHRRNKESKTKAVNNEIPAFKDPTELQAFLFSEIQRGEELLSGGELENAADCFCNAITVCDQPQVLLMALQQSTPPQVFAMIRERMPAALQRLKNALGVAPPPGGVGGEENEDDFTQLVDDDLE